MAVGSFNRDGFGDNLFSGQEVSDKEILALRGQLGAYVSDDLDVQFAYDWMDDQSGVRGAKMLAPEPLRPGLRAAGRAATTSAAACPTSTTPR